MSHLEKFHVCAQCWDIGTDTQCACFNGNYKIITLEFEVCDCCGAKKEEPAETDFNTTAIAKAEKPNH